MKSSIADSGQSAWRTLGTFRRANRLKRPMRLAGAVGRRGGLSVVGPLGPLHDPSIQCRDRPSRSTCLRWAAASAGLRPVADGLQQPASGRIGQVHDRAVIPPLEQRGPRIEPQAGLLFLGPVTSDAPLDEHRPHVTLEELKPLGCGCLVGGRRGSCAAATAGPTTINRLNKCGHALFIQSSINVKQFVSRHGYLGAADRCEPVYLDRLGET